MVAAEANNAWPPHLGLEFRHLLHERGYRRTVCPTSWILDSIEILLNACFRLLRLQFSHGTSRAKRQWLATPDGLPLTGRQQRAKKYRSRDEGTQRLSSGAAAESGGYSPAPLIWYDIRTHQRPPRFSRMTMSWPKLIQSLIYA